VPMGMRFARRVVRLLIVPVMRVVSVWVFMRQWHVGVEMPVSLGEMEPDTDRHEATGHDQWQSDRLPPEQR